MKTRITKKQVFTIPNIMSMVRLAMIPFIVWLYLVEEEPVWTALTVMLSGITDVVDGFIARRFNMITDVGKALDPLADKLTQLAVLICLVTRFPLLMFPLCIMVVKEIASVVLRSVIFKKTGEVQGAHWHGKANTVLLYATMFLHIIWYDIPYGITCVSVGACTCMMIISCVLYSIENVSNIKKARLGNAEGNTSEKAESVESAENK